MFGRELPRDWQDFVCVNVSVRKRGNQLSEQRQRQWRWHIQIHSIDEKRGASYFNNVQKFFLQVLHLEIIQNPSDASIKNPLCSSFH